MADLRQKVEDSAGFYNKSFLNFDYQLASYGFKTLKPYFKGKLGLEVGPASGYMTKLLVNEFEELHVVEGSEQLLNQIPDYPNVKKFRSFVEDYDTSFKYDTIIMSHVLEHISDPILVLKGIYNWLDEEGVFLLAVPNAKSIHRMVAVHMGLLNNEFELNSRDHELGHYRVYDSSLLQQHVVAAGFTILSKGGYFLKPITNGQIEEQWNDEMIEGFYRVGSSFPDHCAEIFIVAKK